MRHSGRGWRAPGVAGGALIVTALALVLAAATLAACGGDNGGQTQPAVYTEADSGKTVSAKVGDVLTLHLVENPSTGYVWTLTLSSGLEQKTDSFIQPSASPGLVGAPGMREWTIAATAAGTQTITAVYKRPWEQTSTGERTFTLTVEVE